MAVIELERVTRRFGDLVAVDDLSLCVEQGEIVGLLGHNGAGKTTLLRVINGLLPPDSGRVRVAGLDPVTDGERVRRGTGVLTEYPALDEYLSVVENLKTYAGINAVPSEVAARQIDQLLDVLDLHAKRDVPTRDLSAGLKQRVALARALVHDPEVLLLDEPTTNMDPVASRRVRELVIDASRRRGHTILLSTHNLEEADQLCDRIGIVRHGRLLVLGTPGELRRQFGATYGVRITLAPGEAQRAAEVVADGARVMDQERIHLGLGTRVPVAVAQLVEAGLQVQAVERDEATLEDLYVQLHGDHEQARTEAPS